jgi:hypothetical protein
VSTDTVAGSVLEQAALGAWLAFHRLAMTIVDTCARSLIGKASRNGGDQLRANALHFLARARRPIAEA